MAVNFSAAVLVACLAILALSAAATRKDTTTNIRWMDMGPAPVPRPDDSGAILTSVPSMVAVIVASFASTLMV
ncbi:hypothetical protein DCAR_0727767 [Daucus carota subsp. sativus]|uniref:Uncharacterized protein n=1 Tax=Daucus carota subsp. sativus TaxID=79200 RepID=A0A161Y568_DAUCS|nr:hypothetical protein DCAR_0727767 [Daucus carota subsp. sativus]